MTKLFAKDEDVAAGVVTLMVMVMMNDEYVFEQTMRMNMFVSER